MTDKFIIRGLNMTLKLKLSLILGFVVLYAFINVLNIASDSLEERANLKKVLLLNQLSGKLSLLIHETQKERGASAGFISSKGKKFTDILPSQRDLTDKKLNELNRLIQNIDLAEFSDELKGVK